MTDPTTTSGPARPAPVPPVTAELFAATGPVVSVYLRTQGALPQAADEVALRWKSVRADLAEQGAPDAALAAVDPLVEGAHAAGQSLVALSNEQGLLYAANLPDLVEEDRGAVGPLPHVLPLLAATQPLLPHLVVVTDRLGAELIAVLPERADEHATVAGEELHVARSAPGGWSQRRFQQRAENRWEANAREVADALTALVDAHRPRVIVLSGDVRAVQLLRDQVPSRVSDLIEEVQGDYSDLEEALRRSAEIVRSTAEDDTAALLETFRERRAAGLAVAGADACLTALRAGQVDTLLIDAAADGTTTAWFGPAANDVARSASALTATGVPDPQAGPLAAVAVRAALGTGATVHVAPPGTPELDDDGICAVLRYR